MREGWNNCKLGELLEIKYGKDHKKLNDGKYPLYGSGGIMRYVDQYLYDDESILIPRKGTLTNLFYLNSPFSTVDTMFWSKINKEKVFPKFLYYLLKTYDFSTLDEGAAIPSLTTKTLREVLVKIPESLETQRKIASILSGYDDLIENNLKRIKILEEMAQQTYEEWFVRMRFPGYETAVMNEETGLPEGWGKKTLIDLGKISTGKTPSTLNEDFYNGNIPFIKTPDMNGSTYVIETNQYLTKLGSDNQKGKLIEKNSLVVSCIGSAGAFALVSKPSQFNQQINAITFKREEYIFFTYCYSKSLKEKLEALGSNGATMTNVNKTKFEKIEIVLPDSQLLNKFHKIFKLNFENILNLQSQNQRLREARDLLLPRLMMGIVEV